MIFNSLVRSVVIVEPENPENIGFIARLSENFDFDIRLVRPKFNLEQCRTTANNAQDKLRETKIYDSVKDAIKDLDFIIGTKPGKGVNSKDFEFRKNTSIMLGRESSGLTKDELSMCDAVVHIEADYDSLNLSHAASVLMYEAFSAEEKSVDNSRLDYLEEEFGGNLRRLIGRSSPTEEEIDGLIGELN